MKDSDELSPEALERRSAEQVRLVSNLVVQASYNHHYFLHWSLFLQRSKNQFGLRFECRQGKVDDSISNGESFFETQLAYFDDVIIPLANKIKECGFFEICCREYLDFAMSNRADWEKQGSQIITEWAHPESRPYQHQHDRHLRLLLSETVEERDGDEESLLETMPHPLRHEFSRYEEQLQQGLEED
jgi:hypothetical protein